MAQLTYRVTGRRGDKRVSQTFRSNHEGRNAASSLAAELENARTVYDVRTRIAGRVVTRTFKRRNADAYAATIEADKLRGVVADPRRSRVTFGKYGRRWLAQRPDLRPSTRERYDFLWRRWLEPEFGTMALGSMTPERWRTWFVEMTATHPGSTQEAKAYRLARAILNTAVEDGVLITYRQPVPR